MTHAQTQKSSWPVLKPVAHWADTLRVLHMWTQIVGKIRLELSPWVNHSWGSALYVTPNGLTTSLIPYQGSGFNIDFDFIRHEVHVRTANGDREIIELRSLSVAGFYNQLMSTLRKLGIDVSILARPVEVEEAIPFVEDDQRVDYDSDCVHAFWKALLQVDRVFSEFRSEFIGKSSPSHFFWGAFDLAVTRFSGRPAPKHPGGAPNCADWVMEEAYSHELSSAGFWPGTGFGEPAFYAYAYPEPDGYRDAKVVPDGAFYHEDLGEYILTYETLMESDDPDSTLMQFLQTTYESAANNGHWDRINLEKSSVKPSDT